jgi:hypothetical protein
MTTATRFRRYQDAAVIGCDDRTGKPLEGTQVRYATVTEVRPWSVTARCEAQALFFLVDSRGRAWRDSGRLRLVPVCCCGKPVLGEPATDPDDPRHREFCSEDCLTAEAERSHGAMAAIEYSAEFD